MEGYKMGDELKPVVIVNLDPYIEGPDEQGEYDKTTVLSKYEDMQRLWSFPRES